MLVVLLGVGGSGDPAPRLLHPWLIKVCGSIRLRGLWLGAPPPPGCPCRGGGQV